MSPKRAPRKLSRDILLAFGIPVIFIPGLLLASLLGWDWRAGLATYNKNPDKYFASEQIFPKKEKLDAYGRLLAYVWVNKELLNALLLENGYAKTLLYKHETTPKYWLLFQNKEAFAKERHYGLWYRSY